jgi:hypothetical protein
MQLFFNDFLFWKGFRIEDICAILLPASVSAGKPDTGRKISVRDNYQLRKLERETGRKTRNLLNSNSVTRN